MNLAPRPFCLFLACSGLDFMKFWLRNTCSANLKRKEFSVRIKHDLYFICILVYSFGFYSGFPLIHFSNCCCFLSIIVICLVCFFLKKIQSCNVHNSCMKDSLFHHRIAIRTVVNKKQVSLRNPYQWKISSPTKPVSLWNQSPCYASIGCRSALGF